MNCGLFSCVELWDILFYIIFLFSSYLIHEKKLSETNIITFHCQVYEYETRSTCLFNKKDKEIYNYSLIEDCKYIEHIKKKSGRDLKIDLLAEIGEAFDFSNLLTSSLRLCQNICVKTKAWYNSKKQKPVIKLLHDFTSVSKLVVTLDRWLFQWLTPKSWN